MGGHRNVCDAHLFFMCNGNVFSVWTKARSLHRRFEIISRQHNCRVHDVCVHDVCVHDVCVHDVCVHNVCVHDVCVHDICGGRRKGRNDE